MKSALQKISLIIILLAQLSISIWAQQILFPGVNGSALLEAVQTNYTPTLDLSYSQARDTLYSQIDLSNDSIATIYADYRVLLPSGVDPTIDLFANGINTEHIYPQGRGATDGTPPHRNMYNLAACRVDVNEARGSLPFANIDDNDTESWYFRNDQLSQIPSTNIDAYSERTSDAFEPRESVKGNVARAVFYIHAIYRDQVMAVDPLFFNMQQADLCAWHFDDPVDTEEMLRNQLIATYQDAKENPFIIDCTLAQRLYCPDMGPCMVATNEASAGKPILQMITDRMDNAHWLRNQGHTSLTFRYGVYSLSGAIQYMSPEHTIFMEDELEILKPQTTGVYIVQVYFEDGHVQQHLIVSN